MIPLRYRINLGVEKTETTGGALMQALGSLGRHAELLLVEDNEADILLTQEALKRAKIANQLHIARDGEQAWRMLRKEPPYSEQPTPDLILLDVNLPRMDGKQLLSAIRAAPEFAD